MSRPPRGFTVIEMIVVVAIVIALAGIVVPVVTNELEDAKMTDARATVNRISTAITQHIKDTSFPPTGKNGKFSFHYLYSTGTTPAGNKFASGSSTSLENFLAKNKFGTSDWKGPYLQEIGTDPWGSRYLVNTHGFFSNTERVWVLSAGPDKRVDTLATDTVPKGDDVALFLE